MPILVNNQPVEEQSVRDEAKRLKDRFRAENRDLDDLTFGIELQEFAREKVITRMLLQQAAGAASPEDFVAQLVTPRAPSPQAGGQIVLPELPPRLPGTGDDSRRAYREKRG